VEFDSMVRVLPLTASLPARVIVVLFAVSACAPT
jgi:hypothetical protein